MNSGVKPRKQTVSIAKSTKQQFLLTNSGVITSILGVSGLKLHSSRTEPVNFFLGTILAGGHNSCLGGHGPEMPPPPRGAGPELIRAPFFGLRSQVVLQKSKLRATKLQKVWFGKISSVNIILNYQAAALKTFLDLQNTVLFFVVIYLRLSER